VGVSPKLQLGADRDIDELIILFCGHRTGSKMHLSSAAHQSTVYHLRRSGFPYFDVASHDVRLVK